MNVKVQQILKLLKFEELYCLEIITILLNHSNRI